MSVFARARRHARRMAGVLALASLFVALADRLAGHSHLAFAAAIAALVLANARMLTFNCPQCGTNLFLRGPLVVPWPNRVCGRCGHDCDEENRGNCQNR